MKSASVRDLRYDFKRIEEQLRQGEIIQITKRNVVIGRLVPEEKATVERKPLPDFAARMKDIFGDYVCPTSAAEMISQERDERW